jgi:hypothetical protein
LGAFRRLHHSESYDLDGLGDPARARPVWLTASRYYEETSRDAVGQAAFAETEFPLSLATRE